jgi:FMN phosphatase YigB (HAD superfamily)
VLFDDSISNLGGAHRMGFNTVWVNPAGELHPDASLTIPDLLTLPHVMPDLWQSGPNSA